MSVTTILGSLLDGYAPSIILAASAVLLLIWQRLSIQMDPREPPLCKPTIPYIGHIIGVLKDQIYYYDRFR